LEKKFGCTRDENAIPGGWGTVNVIVTNAVKAGSQKLEKTI